MTSAVVLAVGVWAAWLLWHDRTPTFRDVPAWWLWSPRLWRAVPRAVPVGSIGLGVLGVLAAVAGDGPMDTLFALLVLVVIAAWVVLSLTTLLAGRPRALVPPIYRKERTP